jgi:hypothetical protein
LRPGQGARLAHVPIMAIDGFVIYRHRTRHWIFPLRVDETIS